LPDGNTQGILAKKKGNTQSKLQNFEQPNSWLHRYLLLSIQLPPTGARKALAADFKPRSKAPSAGFLCLCRFVSVLLGQTFLQVQKSGARRSRWRRRAGRGPRHHTRQAAAASGQVSQGRSSCRVCRSATTKCGRQRLGFACRALRLRAEQLNRILYTCAC
jgi:hypothetical protein